jgi:hypothetical protein
MSSGGIRRVENRAAFPTMASPVEKAFGRFPPYAAQQP